jgi:flagellar biosynthesis protein FlhF
MQEGMQQIKQELGPDAIIIQSRKVRQKGIWGFLRPPKVEITAAVDSAAGSQAKLAALEQSWQQEMGELKQLVNQLLAHQQKQTISSKGPYFTYLQQLVAQGVETHVAQALLMEIEQEYELGDNIKAEVLELMLSKKIQQYLPTEKLPAAAKILVFTGPTGVGKTTTLAKLAAHFVLTEKKRVGMITIDTYRIGAVEQLRTYAAITEIPIEVVITPKNMQAALEKLAGLDLILVDTAGRSAKNSMQVAELNSFLTQLPAAEVFLVLSVTTKAKDLHLITERFRKVGYNRLIFTKLDETANFGAILNTTYATGLPLTYLTTGQNVPDDLEEADREKIAQLILRGEQSWIRRNAYGS